MPVPLDTKSWAMELLEAPRIKLHSCRLMSTIASKWVSRARWWALIMQEAACSKSTRMRLPGFATRTINLCTSEKWERRTTRIVCSKTRLLLASWTTWKMCSLDSRAAALIATLHKKTTLLRSMLTRRFNWRTTNWGGRFFNWSRRSLRWRQLCNKMDSCSDKRKRRYL